MEAYEVMAADTFDVPGSLPPWTQRRCLHAIRFSGRDLRLGVERTIDPVIDGSVTVELSFAVLCPGKGTVDCAFERRFQAYRLDLVGDHSVVFLDNEVVHTMDSTRKVSDAL